MASVGERIVGRLPIGKCNGTGCRCFGHYSCGLAGCRCCLADDAGTGLDGSLIGMSLPFLLRRLGLDPATASGPLVTSLSDIVGVLIYFSLATWLLGIGMD